MAPGDEHGAGRGRSRRRGVRASRVKLAAALSKAGLKTQASLAERIADREGLEAAPRGVVYRVFREQPVDVNTLTRIARALDVDVQDLLLSAESAPAERTDAAEPVSAEPVTAADSPGRGWIPTAAAVVAVAVAVVAVLQAVRQDTPSLAGSRSGDAVQTPVDLAPLIIAVLPLGGEGGGELAEAMRAKLAQRSRVVPIELLDVAAGGDDADAIANRFDADVVVDGRVITFGRHAAVRLVAWTDGVERVFWVAHPSRRHLEQVTEELAGAAIDALAITLAPGGRTSPIPTAAAQENYVRGRHYLDQSRTELNVRRAINHFEAALREERSFAAAQAGLCLALLQQSLVSSEATVLPDAERACSRAAELAPGLGLVQVARGYLARRTGELDRAASYFEAARADDPADPEALIGLAEVALAEYRSGDGAAGERGIGFARQAMEAAPGFWKPPFTLARIHFFTGDVDAAIEIGARAVALDANGLTLANLGTSYFCRGDHEHALEQYRRARTTAPGASMGDEQMCVAYYFARRFEDAVTACRAAVETDSSGGRPAHHEMWGNLADAYRQAGRPDAAADAYARAAELAERKLLVQGHSPNDRAHLAYYYTVLASLEQSRVPAGIREKLPGELRDSLTATADPQALIRVASASALLGQLDTARAAHAAGTADCPGFGASPDLDVLRADSAR